MSFQVKQIIISQRVFVFFFGFFLSRPFSVCSEDKPAFALSEGYPALPLAVAVLRTACQISSCGFVLHPLGLPYLLLSLPIVPLYLLSMPFLLYLPFPAIPVRSSSLTALCKSCPCLHLFVLKTFRKKEKQIEGRFPYSSWPFPLFLLSRYSRSSDRHEIELDQKGRTNLGCLRNGSLNNLLD